MRHSVFTVVPILAIVPAGYYDGQAEAAVLHAPIEDMADDPYQWLLQLEKDKSGPNKNNSNFVTLYRKKPKYKKKNFEKINPLAKLTKGIGEDANKDLNKMMKDASKDMKKALYEIPYLKKVLMGGELARLAFDYMVANTSGHVKRNVKGGFNTAIKGRYKAFKNWLNAAWTGKSNLETVIGDYEDYLSLLSPEGENSDLSLHEYFNATRAAGDEGVYKDYQTIMDKMDQ